MTTNLGSSPLVNRSIVSVTFTGASGLGQAATTTTFFTVTGEILCSLQAYVVETLTQSLGTPKLTLGVTNSTSLFIGATTATTLATGEFWTEATGGGTAAAGIAMPAAMKDILVTANVVGVVGGTNNINGGTLRLTLLWTPMRADAAVA